MRILGIETSCDETAAAIIDVQPTSKITLLSNVVVSSLKYHSLTGGIIPEKAAREQVKYIIPVIQQALAEGVGWNIDTNKLGTPPIDAIAVTHGPGLIGSLLVGVETARSFSYMWHLPIIPVNHLYGHIYANWLERDPHEIHFPALGLIVSGGHTDLIIMRGHGDLKVIGGTRDDAAGEAFDKIGRLLGLPYPAGPAISSFSEKGNSKAFHLPRPMHASADFDFSFSGLKTAVLTLIKKNDWDFTEATFAMNHQDLLADICASAQEAIVTVLVKKTILAAQKYEVKSILLGGGVASNTKLREALREKTESTLPDAKLFVPDTHLCTDNAAMIATAGYFNNHKTSWQHIVADPELYFS